MAISDPILDDSGAPLKRGKRYIVRYVRRYKVQPDSVNTIVAAYRGSRKRATFVTVANGYKWSIAREDILSIH